MASASPHSPSSPRTPGHESPTHTPESPIIPSPPQAAAIQNSPPKPADPRTMTAAQSTQPKPQGSRAQVKTPEPRQSKERMNGQKEMAERSPSTPGHLAPFDWDEFEARYEEALAEADSQEQELLKEFEELVKVSRVLRAPLVELSSDFRLVLQCLGLSRLGPRFRAWSQKTSDQRAIRQDR